jgi:hypothetical protein
VADGLVQRSIRKARGGHESSSLYHRAKYSQVTLLALTGASILLVPISIDPRWIVGPGVIALCAMARLQWIYYKKHL